MKTKSVTIREDQDEHIENWALNLSKFLRQKIDEEIEKRNVEER